MTFGAYTTLFSPFHHWWNPSGISCPLSGSGGHPARGGGRWVAFVHHAIGGTAAAPLASRYINCQLRQLDATDRHQQKEELGVFVTKLKMDFPPVELYLIVSDKRDWKVSQDVSLWQAATWHKQVGLQSLLHVLFTFPLVFLPRCLTHMHCLQDDQPEGWWHLKPYCGRRPWVSLWKVR